MSWYTFEPGKPPAITRVMCHEHRIACAPGTLLYWDKMFHGPQSMWVDLDYAKVEIEDVPKELQLQLLIIKESS